ncbi:MAG: hypothetical protein ITG00_08870 [Flavobacterium sp.]|nr:hypothetical protein [Flavobacterium sp.]
MKNIQEIRNVLLIILSTLFLACGTSKFKGSASDTTGTNGATNGTGKVAPLN